jgi:hypothetical protein
MSAPAPSEYLSPGFDPKSLTVSYCFARTVLITRSPNSGIFARFEGLAVLTQLRSILLAHGVGYPSTTRKGDLVAAFNSDIASRADVRLLDYI